MTYRMLGVLIDGLPGESLTKTAIRESLGEDRVADLAKETRDGHGPWSHEALLQAAELDVLRLILHVLVIANGGKSRTPDPWPRPGVVSKRRRALSAQGHAYLARIRREHAELHGYSLDGDQPEAG